MAAIIVSPEDRNAKILYPAWWAGDTMYLRRV